MSLMVCELLIKENVYFVISIEVRIIDNIKI